MKNSFTFALCLVAQLIAIGLPAQSAKDTIDLKHQFASFNDLRGRGYTNVILVRADLDGITYTEPDSVGGSRVSFTNLAPAVLESWGIPTNRIEISAERAARKSIADRKYKQTLIDAAQRAAQAEAEWAKGQPEREANDRVAESLKALSDAKAAIDAQKDVVRELERENDRLWERYMQGNSDQVTVTGNTGTGVSVDSEDTRRAAYYNSKRALREAREKLEDIQAGRR